MYSDVSKTLLSIRMDGISAKGRTDLIKFVSGGRLTPLRAIQAKCYDCMGYYADGKRDCEQHDCPLHRFMPYREGASAEVVGDVGEEEDDEDQDAHN